jgi:hypothetical protein
MMTTPDEPRFEVEINYTEKFYKDIVKKSFSKKTLMLLGLLILLMIILDLFLAYDACTLNTSYTNCYLLSGFIVFLFLLPFQLYELSVKQLTQTIERWGTHLKLTLNDEFFSWHWEKGLSGKIKWCLFFELKKTEDCWWLHLDKYLVLHLPTEQVSPEAQAFILQKLTEHNVPIKG